MPRRKKNAEYVNMLEGIKHIPSSPVEREIERSRLEMERHRVSKNLKQSAQKLRAEQRAAAKEEKSINKVQALSAAHAKISEIHATANDDIREFTRKVRAKAQSDVMGVWADYKRQLKI